MSGLSTLDQGRLQRYMTLDGFQRAKALFGAAGMEDAVVANAGDLRLAAAELLEGLSADPETGAQPVSAVKVGALELKFGSAARSTPDWLAMAARLRAQVKTTQGGLTNPAPLLEPWGLE